MATYVEAPTIDVAGLLNDAASSSAGVTDDLLLSAADSCGLLGSAQGLVDEAAAEAARVADAAINKTIETAGSITKKVKDYASAQADTIGGRLSDTFDQVNTKIQDLFANATETFPGSGEFESPDLDAFLSSIQGAVDSITQAFTNLKNLVTDAFNAVTSFVDGFVETVLEIANDLRVLACNGANQALAAVGSGVSSAYDSLAGPLAEGKSSDEIIKEKHSGSVKSAADTAASNVGGLNDQAEALTANLDANVSGNLDSIAAVL